MWKDRSVQQALLAAAVGLAAAGCVSANTRRTIESAEAAATPAQAAAPPIPPDDDAPGGASGASGAAAAKPRRIPDEAALAREVDLESLQMAALARHPELVAAAHRVRAIAEGARAEGSLPAPQVMVDLWQVPITRPWRVDEAGMLMLSLRQEIPPAGMLDRAAEAAGLEARAAASMVAAAARALEREVGLAYAMYLEATARHRAHGDHAGIFEQMSAAARARYTAGGSVSDVVKADLERARLDADLAREHGRLEEARAALNALLSRPVDAPLGPPRDVAPRAAALTPAQAAALAEARSPEIAAADAMKSAATKMAEAADREASIPTFMLGLSYFHPVGGMEAGWGASVGMSLPWLWDQGSRRAEGASQRALAEAASARAARLRARGEAAEAAVAVQEAARRLTALRDGALPSAQRALEMTRAGYAAGGSDFLMWLDAAHATLEIELEITEARGDLERALVELDWAVGGRAPRKALEASK